MGDNKILPDGIYLTGKVDKKFSPEPKQGQTRKYKVLINLADYREKQEVSIPFVDYEKIQVGDDFRSRCQYNCFNNRVYWSLT